MECGIVGEALRSVSLDEAWLTAGDIERMRERYHTKMGEDSKEANEFRQALFGYLA